MLPKASPAENYFPKNLQTLLRKIFLYSDPFENKEMIEEGEVIEGEVLIAYVRVSIVEENVQNQIQAIKRFVGGERAEKIRFFVDIGVSGIVEPGKRKGFREMLEFIQAVRTLHPKANILLFVYEVSRLGRNFLETLNLIHRFEHELGVRILSVSEKEQFMNILDKGIRNLILSILAWVADREREILRERTKEGMRRAKAEGKHISRPRIELTSKQIRQIKHYQKLGLSIYSIAKLLGIKYPTLRRRLIELGLYQERKRNREQKIIE